MKKAMMMLMFLLLLLTACGAQEDLVGESTPPNKFMDCWQWWLKGQVALINRNETYFNKYGTCWKTSQICESDCLEEGDACDRSYELAKKECVKD